MAYYATIDPRIVACPVSCCAVLTFAEDPPHKDFYRLETSWLPYSSPKSLELDKLIDDALKSKSVHYCHTFIDPEALITNRSRVLRRNLDLLVSQVQYKARIRQERVYCGVEEYPVSMLYQYVKPSKGKHWSINLAQRIALLKRSWMIQHHWGISYPEYGWDNNQGTLDVKHCRALLEKGPSPLHFGLVSKEAPRWWVRQLRERNLEALQSPSLIILRDGYSRDTWVVRQWLLKFGHKFDEYLTEEEKKFLLRLCIRSQRPNFALVKRLPKILMDFPDEIQSLKEPPTLSLSYPNDTLHKNKPYPDDTMLETHQERFLRMVEEQNPSLCILDKLLTVDRIATVEMQQELQVIPRTDQTWFFYLSKVLLREYKDRVPGLITALKVKGLSRPIALHHAFRRRTSTLLNSCYNETAPITLQYIDLKAEIWKVITECRSTAE